MSHQLPLGHIPYDLGPAAGAKAAILLTHFDGAVDAGFTGRIAVDHLLRSLPSQRVVTFSTDALIDYRSHRPIVTVSDWMTQQMDTPTIAVDMIHDDAGTPVWILHGPEPDLQWETFAATVSRLARDAGVELTVSMHGIPSSVPHTRPVQVHAHATAKELLPQQPDLPGPMHMQASFSAFLQQRLHHQGIDGMALLPTVPYYIGETPYPPAASTMLTHLSSVAHLALPVGDLEQGSQTDREAIDALVEKTPELGDMIAQLERTFDDLAAEGKLPHLANAWDEAAAVLTGIPTGNNSSIGDSVEAFLENIARLEADQDADPATTEPRQESPAQPTPAEDIHAVLERIRQREERQAAGLPPLPQEPRRRRPTEHPDLDATNEN